MDYKTFYKEIENTFKIYFDYVNQKNDKNISRINQIVNDYLDEIKQDNYSIKSYKAKIIQKELEQRFLNKELTTLHEEFFTSLNHAVVEYFKDFNIKKEKSSPFKNRDIKESCAQLKKEKQDFTTRKNNLLKESQTKTKEFDLQLEELEKTYSDLVLENKNKLIYELGKNDENNQKDYQEYQELLLDENDHQTIKELKDKIKEIREKYLVIENELKIASFNELKEIDDAYHNNLHTLESEKTTTLLELNRKFLEYDHKINTLSLEIEYIEKSYDDKTEIKDLCEFYPEVNQYLSLLEVCNEYLVNNTPVNYSVLTDFIKLYLNHLYIHTKKHNIYAGINSVIKNVISKIEVYLDLIVESNSLYETSFNVKKSMLLNALTDYKPDPKKVNLEDFLDNIITSLQRYFDNSKNEMDIVFNSFYDICKKTILTLFDELNKYITIPYIESKYLINNYEFNSIDITFLKTDSIGEYEYYPQELNKLKELIKFPLDNRKYELEYLINLELNDYQSKQDQLSFIYSRDLFKNEYDLKKKTIQNAKDLDMKLVKNFKNTKTSMKLAHSSLKQAKKAL